MDRYASLGSQQIVNLALLAGLCMAGAYLVSTADVGITALVAVGLAAAVVAFLRAEAAIYLLIAAMLLSPEIGIGEIGGERASKGITLRFDDFLLVIVGIAWIFKTAVYKELNLLSHTPLNKPIAFYSVICVLSTLIGMQAGRVLPLTGSMFVLKYLEYFFLFWMVLNTAQTRSQLRRYLLVLFAVAAVVSVVAIAQIPSGGRVTAPFQGSHGEPNTLANYLLFVMAVLLGVLVSIKRHRLLLLLVGALMLLAFVYTLSRSSYVAAIPMLYVLFYLTRKYMLMIFMTIALLFVIMAPAALLPEAVVARITSTFAEEQTAGLRPPAVRFDPSTTARLTSAKVALEAFAEKPLLGWGVTGFGFLDSQYLRVLVETGLIGFLLFLYLVYTVFSVAWQAVNQFRGRDPLFFGVACGFIAGTTALLVSSLGTNVFIIVRIMEPFWLLCAIVSMAPRVAGEEIQEAVAAPAAPAWV